MKAIKVLSDKTPHDGAVHTTHQPSDPSVRTAAGAPAVPAHRHTAADPRWRRIVESASSDTEGLADLFAAQLVGNDAYDAGLVDDAELRSAARSSFKVLMSALLDAPESANLGDLPGRIGRTRARQNVPVDNLIEAVRADFGIIWLALLESAKLDDMATLALHVDELWTLVSRFARQVHQGYRDERAAMAQEEREYQREYLLELFSPAAMISSRLNQISIALGVDPNDTFCVVAGRSERNSKLFHTANGQMRAAGVRFHVVDRSDVAIAFWPTTTKVREPHPDTLPIRALTGAAAGFIPEVNGLASISDAAHAAAEIGYFLRPEESGLIQLSELWPRIAKGKVHGSDQLEFSILSNLRSIGEEETGRVLETVNAYMETGSAMATAQRLYCHRNTVLNRLQRFRQVTGIDVTVPKQAALAIFILS